MASILSNEEFKSQKWERMAEAKAAQLSLARKDLRHTISCCNQAGATQLLLHCHWPRTFQAVALAPDCGRNLRHSPSHLSLSLLLWKSFNLPISAYLSYGFAHDDSPVSSSCIPGSGSATLPRSSLEAARGRAAASGWSKGSPRGQGDENDQLMGWTWTMDTIWLFNIAMENHHF